MGNHVRFGSWWAFCDGVRLVRRSRQISDDERRQVERLLVRAHRAMDALGYPAVIERRADNQLTLWGAA